MTDRPNTLRAQDSAMDGSTAELLCSIHDRCATLTLNRPAAGNALSLRLMHQLRAQLRSLAQAPDVDVLVLRAEGRHFCTGADMEWVRTLATEDATLWQQGIDALLGLFADVHALGKPLVAAVQGTVVGAGVALLCLCDAVVAQADARWRLPEIALGMGATAVLPPLQARLAPLALRRLLYENRAWRSDELQAFGLVTELTSAEGLQAALQARVAQWRALPATAVTATKQLLLELDEGAFQRRLELVRPHARAELGSAEDRARLGALFPPKKAPSHAAPI